MSDLSLCQEPSDGLLLLSRTLNDLEDMMLSEHKNFFELEAWA